MIYLKPQVTLEFNFLLIHQCRSFFDTPEEIFTTGHISHAGQTIGMIVAETEAIARKAVKAVKITYKNHKEPILVSFKEKDTQLLLRRNNENKECRNNTSNVFFSKSFLVEVSKRNCIETLNEHFNVFFSKTFSVEVSKLNCVEISTHFCLDHSR
jgi:hypothetical protein